MREVKYYNTIDGKEFEFYSDAAKHAGKLIDDYIIQHCPAFYKAVVELDEKQKFRSDMEASSFRSIVAYVLYDERWADGITESGKIRYVSFDGEEFTKAEQCRAHEDALVASVKQDITVGEFLSVIADKDIVFEDVESRKLCKRYLYNKKYAV